MHLAHLPSVRADQRPDAPALTDDHLGELSNTSFDALVTLAVGSLQAAGVGPGDVVAVKLPNRVELVVALFAAWRLGAAVTPVNPALTADDVSFQLSDAGAVVVVTETHESSVTIPVLTVDELLSDSPLPRQPLPEPTDDSLALLVFTSGSTSTPKGCELTHANLNAMTAAMIEAMRLTEDDHSLLILPLFHVNGIVVSVLSPLLAGGQSTIAGRFAPQTFFDHVQDRRPTYFSAVPAIYTMLTALPADVTPDTSSLRFAACGAAPMPPAYIAAFEERYGVDIVEGYGLSEGTCASTSNPLDGPRKPGTVGIALPGQTVAIMGADGTLITDGSPGEVVIKGPNVMRGYLNRPDETAQALRDGWLHTGDVGTLDDDGYLTLRDRIKDLIIRGGENIMPQQIEHAIYQLPAVLETAVVGRPHPVLGEVPVAFVSLREPAALTPDEIMTFLSDKLAKFKQPTDIYIVDQVPKNPVGKIDKPRLRRELTPEPA
jgi:acyl-CoA synthetase (AMP-forming)/AMP-acid ligase II